MTGVVDTVNFNSDASCLSSTDWLGALDGREESTFYRWLLLYRETGRKVVLGFPGATVADIATFNPEAIELINGHPEVFEILLRPFAHDIGLLRSEQGFRLNVELGIRAIRSEFDNVCDDYLPPEFMCNSAQVHHLAGRGIRGVFIYAERFNGQIAPRIPTRPYRLRGLFGSSLTAIPIDDAVSQSYLTGIHEYSATEWNRCLAGRGDGVACSWRDGESAFLLPDTVNREAAWISGESRKVRRFHLKERAGGDMDPPLVITDGRYLDSYPIHSFSAWIREMKMYWFIQQLQKIEEKLSSIDTFRRHVWLQAINSDILSAVEKEYPVIKLKNGSGDEAVVDHTLFRQPKEFEGEEYLQILLNPDGQALRHYESSPAPHMARLRARVRYLERLTGTHGS